MSVISEVNHQPYTLHPTTYTLHPTPYTLHPIPSTLQPAPYPQHPTPWGGNGPALEPVRVVVEGQLASLPRNPRV